MGGLQHSIVYLFSHRLTNMNIVKFLEKLSRIRFVEDNF